MNKRILAPTLCVLAMLLFSFLTASTVHAQPAAPTVASLVPEVVQRGTMARVTLTGSNLSAVRQVVSADPAGVTVRVVGRSNDRLDLEIDCDFSATPGSRTLRAIGPFGVSGPLELQVDSLPVVTQSSRAAGYRIHFPAVYLGRLSEPGATDSFELELAAGTEVVFEAEPASGSQFRPMLRLSDATDREVAATSGEGSPAVLKHRAATAGRYTLEVRDFKFAGGPAVGYRLRGGPVGRIDAAYPLAGNPGALVELELYGSNLRAGQTQPVRLPASSGAVPLADLLGRRVAEGLLFSVVDAPTHVETESGDSAMALKIPSVLSGRIDTPDDVDRYSFEVAEAMDVRIAVMTDVHGSPVDALVSLFDASGNLVMQADETGGGRAVLDASLAAGSYEVQVRDLLFGFGPTHVYRLELIPKPVVTPSFAVRFGPDDPRVPRDGRTRAWCVVDRMASHAAPLRVRIEGLPEGVHVEPAEKVIGPDEDGLFVFHASAQAPEGNWPIRLVAEQVDGASQVVGTPLRGPLAVGQAWLTVTPPAPFNLAAVNLDNAQLTAFGEELDTLRSQFDAPELGWQAASEEWARRLRGGPRWVTLDGQIGFSGGGATMDLQPDGSFRVMGNATRTDTYVVIGDLPLDRITAVKIEALSDPSLPQRGPGRFAEGGGNFVLSYLFVEKLPRASEEKDPEIGQVPKVELVNPQVSFAQAGLGAELSLQYTTPSGWAIYPRFGEDHWVIFEAESPVQVESGDRLRVALLQNFQQNFTLGRFRIAVTDAERPSASDTLPGPIRKIVEMDPANRSDADRTQLTRYYMERSPRLAKERARIALLAGLVDPWRRKAELEATMDREDPAIEAEQAAWEAASFAQDTLHLDVWRHAGPFAAPAGADAFDVAFGPESEEGFEASARFSNDAIGWVPRPAWVDAQVHNVFTGNNSANYLRRVLTVSHPTELNVSLGSDDGIRVWLNGEELLSKNIGRGAAADQERVKLALKAGENRLLIKVSNGGGPSGFYFRADGSVTIPQAIRMAGEKPASGRNAFEQALLRSYFRGAVSESLAGVRAELAELDVRSGVGFPPKTKAGERSAISVRVARPEGFAGSVKVTLDGFVEGIDPATGRPPMVTTAIEAEAVELSGEGNLGVLTFRPLETVKPGRRLVLLRGEATIDGVPWVQYSAPFVLEVGP